MKEPRGEAHARLAYWFDRPGPGHLPEVLIAAAADRTKVVVADTARSRLYLFDRSGGDWQLWGDWYTSIGRGGTAKRREGDDKTPLGVYFVTMWVGDRYLPELYGAGRPRAQLSQRMGREPAPRRVRHLDPRRAPRPQEPRPPVEPGLSHRLELRDRDPRAGHRGAERPGHHRRTAALARSDRA